MNDSMYPCLWFNGVAKEAADFYCSVFPDSRITSMNPVVVMFEINKFKLMALNGGNNFKFNESVSFVVECRDQEEIDHYWEKLTAGGSESMCGWLKDKYGVSWQIVPSVLKELMSDPMRSEKVMKAFLQMKKFNIAKLMEA